MKITGTVKSVSVAKVDPETMGAGGRKGRGMLLIGSGMSAARFGSNVSTSVSIDLDGGNRWDYQNFTFPGDVSEQFEVGDQVTIDITNNSPDEDESSDSQG